MTLPPPHTHPSTRQHPMISVKTTKLAVVITYIFYYNLFVHGPATVWAGTIRMHGCGNSGLQKQ